MKSDLSKTIERCRSLLKADHVTLVHQGKVTHSSSPKVTGQAKPFQFKTKTRSGKAIHSFHDHPSHKDYTTHDHVDAYHAHAKHVSELSDIGSHPHLIEHHKKAMQYHWQAASGGAVKKALELFKAHRHAKIGKTRRGHHVYAGAHAKHPHYSKFTSEDHHDAAHTHHKRTMRLMSAIAHFSKKEKKSLVQALQRLLRTHATHAHGHHSAAHEKGK